MSEYESKIKPAEIYKDLSADDIAEMMAEAAAVDALFQSGRISTLYPIMSPVVVSEDDDAEMDMAVTAA